MEIREGQVGGLHFDLVDLVPPWVRDPGTILFHHGVGANSELWAEWIPVLADRYRIVRFDMRGMGRSAAAIEGDRLPFDRLADDVIMVADAVGTARFHLVGESIGGTVALWVGLRHPERIRTLTASNAAHLGSSIRNVGDWKSVLTEEGGAAWSARMMAHRFFPDAIPRDKWAWYEAQQGSHPSASILAGLECLIGVDLSDRLAELRTPTLLLHADSSPFIGVEVMADLHARLPRSELHVFPHARHGLPFSHARESAQALRAFLHRQCAAER